MTDAERSDLLALLNEQKKYCLVWEEKPEQVEEDLRNKLPVLREVTDRRITARHGQTGKQIDTLGGELSELKEAITRLQKGELILKDSLSINMESGKKFKRQHVKQLI